MEGASGIALTLLLLLHRTDRSRVSSKALIRTNPCLTPCPEPTKNGCNAGQWAGVARRVEQARFPGLSRSRSRSVCWDSSGPPAARSIHVGNNLESWLTSASWAIVSTREPVLSAGNVTGNRVSRSGHRSRSALGLPIRCGLRTKNALEGVPTATTKPSETLPEKHSRSTGHGCWAVNGGMIPLPGSIRCCRNSWNDSHRRLIQNGSYDWHRIRFQIGHHDRHRILVQIRYCHSHCVLVIDRIGFHLANRHAQWKQNDHQRYE